MVLILNVTSMLSPPNPPEPPEPPSSLFGITVPDDPGTKISGPLSPTNIG